MIIQSLKNEVEMLNQSIDKKAEKDPTIDAFFAPQRREPEPVLVQPADDETKKDSNAITVEGICFLIS
jgi:hypothetical protein